VPEDLIKSRFTLGGPKQCSEDLAMLRERLGISHLVMKMKFPGVCHEDVMRSIELFAGRVMPAD
jgi:alkanesulfonate monooxygenase SsuD/methylene tetrahydromethanopterin reductase-like flavin-dependent oxidoreductase (luciferase family)